MSPFVFLRFFVVEKYSQAKNIHREDKKRSGGEIYKPVKQLSEEEQKTAICKLIHCLIRYFR